MMKHDVANVKDEELADAGRYTIYCMPCLGWREELYILYTLYCMPCLGWREEQLQCDEGCGP